MLNERPASQCALAVSPNFSSVAIGYASGLTVIDLASGAGQGRVTIPIVPSNHDACLRVEHLAFATHTCLAIAYSNGRIRVFDIIGSVREVYTTDVDARIMGLDWVSEKELLIHTASQDLLLATMSSKSSRPRLIREKQKTMLALPAFGTSHIGVLEGQYFKLFELKDGRLTLKYSQPGCSSITYSSSKRRFYILCTNHMLKGFNLDDFTKDDIAFVPKTERIRCVDLANAITLEWNGIIRRVVVLSRPTVSSNSRLTRVLKLASSWDVSPTVLVTASNTQNNNPVDLVFYHPSGAVKMKRTITATTGVSLPTTVLHISDLHFSAGSDPNGVARRLISRIEEDEKQIDYIVVSGDIADQGSAEGYKAGVTFIHTLAKSLGIAREEFPHRIVLIPGNHDVDFTQSSSSFQYVGRFSKQYNAGSQDAPKAEQGQLQTVPGEYRLRFSRFSKLFYAPLMGIEYPSKETAQWKIYNYKSNNLLIVALNSAWRIDHIHPERASLCPEAVTNALSQATAILKKRRQGLLLAVVHHPCATGMRSIPEEEAQMLSSKDVACILHGDSHRAENNRAQPTAGALSERVGAGMAGDKSKLLPPGAQWMFHYFEVDWNKKTLTVTTRKRNSNKAHWLPELRYGRGKKLSDSYVIGISSDMFRS